MKKSRPKNLLGSTVRVETGCGNLYITVNHEDGKGIFEVFATLGKAGGCATVQNEALTRSITLGLRFGIPVSEFVRQLKGIRCPSPNLETLSCADAIAKALEIGEKERGEG